MVSAVPADEPPLHPLHLQLGFTPRKGSQEMASALKCRPITVDTEPVTRYVVAYAKVVDDKKEGVYVQGIYLGGIGETKESDQQIARECVNTCRGGTIIPKLFPSLSGESIIAALDKARVQFTQMEMQMLQAEEIYTRCRK